MEYKSNYTGIQIDEAVGKVLDGEVTFHDNTKQDTLVSGTNIKTINDNSILGSGNIEIQSGGGTWGSITGDIEDQTDLNTVLTNKVGNDVNTNTSIYNVWYGTQAQYEALSTKDSNTLYFTPEE